MGNHTPLTEEERDGLRISPEDMGGLLKSRRLARGETLSAAGRRINVNRATVARWEKGELDSTTIRLFNYLFESEQPGEKMWRRRALMAEEALKKMADHLAAWKYANLQNLRGDL